MKRTIRIKSFDAAADGFREAWRAVQESRPLKPRTGTYFTSLEAARRVLTPKRLQLLRVIRAESPRSIYGLAQIVGRDITNVADDVRLLAEHRLVSLKKARGRGKRGAVVPRVTFSEIEVRIAV
jgi:predicted transcriptional regulator